MSSLEFPPPVVMVECSIDVACFFEQLLIEFAPDRTLVLTHLVTLFPVLAGLSPKQ